MSDATIKRTDERVTLRYERDLRHPVDAVWKAITDPAEIDAWFGTRPQIDLRVGGQYVSHHQTRDRVVDRIIRLDPPRLFEHTFWAHLNPDALVTWELAPIPDGCRLTLTHTMTTQDLRTAAAAFGLEDPMVQLPRTGAGWHRLLDRLAAVLSGRDLEWSEPDLKALEDHYADVQSTVTHDSL